MTSAKPVPPAVIRADGGRDGRQGQVNRSGQVNAGVASYGRSSGPHLHFEIHVSELENHKDPLAFLAGHEAPSPFAG